MVEGFVVVESDITVSRKAVEQVTSERARLAMFIEHAPAAVAMFDRELRYLAASRRWYSDYKLEGRQILGRSHYDVFANVSDNWRAIHQRCLAGAVERCEDDPWRPEGWDHDQHLQWEVRPWHDPDGSVGGLVMFTQDVTDQYEAAEHLRLAGERTELALEGGNLGLWDWNTRTGEAVYDQRWAGMLGESLDALEPHVTEWFSRVHPDDMNRAESAMEAHFKGESPEYRCVHRMRHRDGGWRWISASGRVVSRGSDRQALRMVGTHMDVTAEYTAREELQRREAALANTARLARVGWWEIDVESMTPVWSEQMRLMHEVAPDYAPTLAGMLSFLEPDCRERVDALIEAAIELRQPFDVEVSIITAKGGELHVRMLGEPTIDNDRLTKIVGAMQDITEQVKAREHAESTLREVEGLWNTIDAHSIVSITDRRGRIIEVNEAFCQITGYTREELIGQDHRIINAGHHHGTFWAELWETVRSGRTWRGEVCNRAKDGSIFWVDSIITPFVDNQGQIEKYVSIRQNVTDRKLAEEELRVAARTDKLTGLPNRALFNDRLQQAVRRVERNADYHFAVLFLDFDRFKLINDSLGHNVGDQLLQAIASRLRHAVRAGDTAGMPRENTAARLGGDEFVVLLDGLSKPEDAIIVAQRLLEAFAAPYLLGEHEVYSSASIGVVTSDTSGANAESILGDADTAMYEAKLAGKSRYVVFDVSMRQRVQARLNLENDLRKAMDAAQFLLHYQPIVNLRTGEVHSVEALIRWNHPDRGMIPPVEFIPVAEDTGQIVPIGEWVLREACRQFAQWRAELGEGAPASISVNLSRAQLMLVNLPQTITEILNEFSLEPACLHLEVTESAVMKDTATGVRLLRAIKDIGVMIDLDDFGTGYSSLASLHQFPIDVLKIDRSFIANVSRGRDFAALVQAISQLARNLNISVVAEGIETIDQVAVLQSLDYDLGQGYLFSKPLPADQVPGFHVKPELFHAVNNAEPFTAA